MAFIVSSKRHKQSGVNKIAQVSKRQQVVSSPDPFDRQSYALTHSHCAPLENNVILIIDIPRELAHLLIKIIIIWVNW